MPAAAELLAQAEHDDDARSICLTTSKNTAVMIKEEIKKQVKLLKRKEIIKIARLTIANSVNRKSIPEFQIKSEKLKEKRGAFVTINKFGQLRGCIGYTQPIYPLFQTIQQVAKAAAFEDPRFSPVTQDELKRMIK